MTRLPFRPSTALGRWLSAETAEQPVTAKPAKTLGAQIDELIQSLQRPVVELDQPDTKSHRVHDLPVGVTTVTQHVLPRFADGKRYPSGGLRGHGPASVIQGDSETERLPAGMRAVIVTEDYNQDLAQWQGGAHGRESAKAAVLQTVLEDFTVCGHDSTNTDYAQGPAGFDPSQPGPDRYDLVRIRSTGARVQGIKAFHCPGTCFAITRGWGNRLGHPRPADTEATRVWDCEATWAYRGFEINTVDAMVGRLQGYALRDYGVKFATGATQIDGAIHFWGIGGEHGAPGVAVWFDRSAGPCWGDGSIYAKSANIGVLVESSGNDLPKIYSHTCWGDACVKVTGKRNTLRLTVDLPQTGKQPVGLDLGGQYNMVSGRIDVVENSTGCVLHGGVGQELTGLQIRQRSGGTAIRVEHPLSWSKIDALVVGGEMGLDL